MIQIAGADRVLETLRKIEANEVLVEEALTVLTSIISENLSLLGECANAQNAGQIANLIFLQIAPHDPFPELIKSRLDQGILPEFSDDPPSQHALERGVAIIMSDIVTSYRSDLPKRGAQFLGDYIQESGYLPSPGEVRE